MSTAASTTMKYHLTPAIRAAWGGDTPPELNLINWAKQFTDGTGTFIDVGAHVGSWSCEMGDCFGVVYAIEPNPEINKLLKKNLWDVFDVKGSIIGECACGAENETRALTTVSADAGGSSFLPAEVIPKAWQGQLEKPRSEKVEVWTVDHLVTVNFFHHRPIKMIKVDVEGWEIEVLRGAVETIKKYQPVILFECWQGEWFATQRAALFAYVRDVLKYRITPIGGWDEMFLAEPLP